MLVSRGVEQGSLDHVYVNSTLRELEASSGPCRFRSMLLCCEQHALTCGMRCLWSRISLNINWRWL